MTERKSDFTLPTNMLDDLFSTQEERDDAKLSKIRDIPLIEIDDFPEHPFKVRDDEDKFNEKLGVTKAQEQAMLAGSMIRWDSIAAKPKSYDENGKAIKPKDYER